ncbi:hypothetical protein C8F01DRAFT_1094193 [Mycena amicta]|nr:hypothetical protein C8F01DRAFT_1094193 [Mycena amicta]
MSGPPTSPAALIPYPPGYPVNDDQLQDALQRATPHKTLRADRLFLDTLSEVDQLGADGCLAPDVAEALGFANPAPPARSTPGPITPSTPKAMKAQKPRQREESPPSPACNVFQSTPHRLSYAWISSDDPLPFRSPPPVSRRLPLPEPKTPTRRAAPSSSAEFTSPPFTQVPSSSAPTTPAHPSHLTSPIQPSHLTSPVQPDYTMYGIPGHKMLYGSIEEALEAAQSIQGNVVVLTGAEEIKTFLNTKVL